MSPKNVVSSSVNFVTTVVYISILLNLATAVKPKGFSMKMIRSDSKESPLYPRYANLSEGERFQRLVEQSKARARYLGSARAAAYNKSSSMNPDIIRIPIKYMEDRSYYIGQVGIGNFSNQPQYYYLIIDTGSDLMWTQCHGGNNYFYQDPPVYDQGSSSTYDRIPCVHLDECDSRHCENGLCTYKEGYVSGPETFGHLAYETFTINSNTGDRESVAIIIMGCGIDQRNFGPLFGVPEKRDGDQDFPPPIPAPGTAPIAGILGLGQDTSNFSLVLQLDVDNKKFEYCLQSYDLHGIASSYTYLRFGSDAIIGGGPEVLKTPIIQDPNFKSPYHLILEDISVGNRRVRFQPSDFQIRADGNGGTIIDSGAPFTIMRMRHFRRVKQVLLNYFADFRIQPVDREPGMLFDPCFRIPSGFNEYPEITFHFQRGADFVIKQRSGSFTYYKDENLLCFAIIGLYSHLQYDVTLGAMQQANKRILYDLNEKALSFTEEECNFGS
ncbi:aspartic proteinase nepenthesin-2-like [Papaver somniferum]|uniref:aspartic proteinase nepenthesin-2-like n=1 Tax=Papaver somniferum TaxID=3469 RepID=UPI000E7024B1|nr:aspartic proteinase nepenthesin-2-like [Papaver somniferum]